MSRRGQTYYITLDKHPVKSHSYSEPSQEFVVERVLPATKFLHGVAISCSSRETSIFFDFEKEVLASQATTLDT